MERHLTTLRAKNGGEPSAQLNRLFQSLLPSLLKLCACSGRALFGLGFQLLDLDLQKEKRLEATFPYHEVTSLLSITFH